MQLNGQNESYALLPLVRRATAGASLPRTSESHALTFADDAVKQLKENLTTPMMFSRGTSTSRSARLGEK